MPAPVCGGCNSRPAIHRPLHTTISKGVSGHHTGPLPTAIALTVTLGASLTCARFDDIRGRKLELLPFELERQPRLHFDGAAIHSGWLEFPLAERVFDTFTLFVR